MSTAASKSPWGIAWEFSLDGTLDYLHIRSRWIYSWKYRKGQEILILDCYKLRNAGIIFSGETIQSGEEVEPVHSLIAFAVIKYLHTIHDVYFCKFTQKKF